MIIITTPTGAIGHQVLEHVLRGEEPIRVIARDPSGLPSHVRERVDIVRGSHGDTTVVNQAFAGADSVFWVVPPDPRAQTVDGAYLDFTRPACAAFKSQGIKRVVGISALGRGTPAAAHAGFVTASLKMDDLIASTGVHYRAVTNPSFMDNLLRQVELIKNQGMFSLPISGDLKQPSACTRDIAATAAKLLLDQSWNGVGSVPVLGPEDLSYNDMATIMSEVLGKPVRFQEAPGQAFKARLLERGMSEAMAQANLDMWDAYNQGLDAAEPRTPQSTTPTSFRQWCEEELKPRVVA
ncbi:MAG TPA: NAD(P)H-binding protein [Pyrinomonadaceae bacterium]|nr:NAD(P)H-binding protein [Pyrinomonadaceae bacterium]